MDGLESDLRISKAWYRNLYLCFRVVSVQSRFRYSLLSQRVIQIYPEFKGISSRHHHNKVEAMTAELGPSGTTSTPVPYRSQTQRHENPGASLSKDGKISKRCARGRKCLCQHNKSAHVGVCMAFFLFSTGPIREIEVAPNLKLWLEKGEVEAAVSGAFLRLRCYLMRGNTPSSFLKQHGLHPASQVVKMFFHPFQTPLPALSS